MSRFRFSCTRFVNNVLGHPRAVLLTAALFLVVGAYTSIVRTPEYMRFPMVSGTLSLLGAAACVYAMIRPTTAAMALSGAALAGAVASRGFGLAATVALDPWNPAQSWTYLVGGLVYLFILTVLPSLYGKHLVPWAVCKVVDEKVKGGQ